MWKLNLEKCIFIFNYVLSSNASSIHKRKNRSINGIKLYFDTKISAFNSFSKTYQVGNRTYVVNIFFEMIFTIIDGKVANAILNVNSSKRCNIYLASPTQMNDIETICNKETNDISLLFGLSPLHAYIRYLIFWMVYQNFQYLICFKHFSGFLNASCKLLIAWILRWHATKEFQVVFKTTKGKIQKEFRERLGLLVDMPKTCGSGTSNDGNTSRRAFEKLIFFLK